MTKASDAERPVLLWFRRDLRLADNLAFQAAVASKRPIIPVFILENDPPVRGPGGAGLWWLDKSLKALAAEMETRGSRLMLRRGEAPAVLGALIEQTGAITVLWNRGYEPGLDARDQTLAEALQARGVKACSCEGKLLLDPEAVRTKTGGPYGVFTPFWRTASGLIPVAEPAGGAQDHPKPQGLAGGRVAERLEASPDHSGLVARLRLDPGRGGSEGQSAGLPRPQAEDLSARS